jgi:hypothetical protein
MALTKRERHLAIAFLVAGSVFALDAIALKPYIAHRTALLDQHAAKSRDLADAREMVQKEKKLRKVIAGLGQFVASDTSGAEGQFLHLLHGWEKEAGVGKASFQRMRAQELDGYTHLTFHVTATGRMPAVAMLLYHVEAANIPLRLDDVQITPKKDSGDELQVQMIVSTLCRKGEPAKRAAQRDQVALDAPANGGRAQ